MNEVSVRPVSSPPVAASRRFPWYHWRRIGFNFLTISVLAHLIFGLGATYFIVQTFQAKRKQTFTGPPAGTNAPTHAMEHKVQMQKRQQTMSAPAPVKRITTTSNAKVALPATPAMPKMDSALAPMAMTGMGGTGVGLGMGAGGGGAGGGSGNGLNNFLGSLQPSAGFVGTFYDLKQTPARQPTGMTVDVYAQKVVEFATGDFKESVFAPYFKSSKPIYSPRIFTPDIPAQLGPAAFGLQDEVQPRMWVVLYKVMVTPPQSGTFRFAGQGDDVLFVRFDNKFVLDACWRITAGLGGMTRKPWSWNGVSKPGSNNGMTTGVSFSVDGGHAYPMEVLIGEQPGGRSHAALLIQQDGEHYTQGADGNNILNIFRTRDEPLPTAGPGMTYAPYVEGGLVWKATPYKEL